MEFDAVVLAGGRSSRLGGTAKAMLEIDGRTLLEITLAAVTDARRTVVVGDVVAPPGILVTREAPVFGGPAAGIAAGLAALDSTADHVLVLACDMPRVSEVVTALRAAGEGIAVDEAREQYLAGLYPSLALREAALRQPGSTPVAGGSVRSLLAAIEKTRALPRIAVPPGSTHDIDTWTDAELFGAHA